MEKLDRFSSLSSLKISFLSLFSVLFIPSNIIAQISSVADALSAIRDGVEDSPQIPHIYFSISPTNGTSDECVLAFLDEATSDYEWTYDALKMESFNTAAIEMALVTTDSNLLTVDARPFDSEGFEVPIYLDIPAAGTYSFFVGDVVNMPYPVRCQVHLAANSRRCGGYPGLSHDFMCRQFPADQRAPVYRHQLDRPGISPWQLHAGTAGVSVRGDPMSVTSLRRVKLNSILRYGLEIYNAKLDGAKRPSIATKVRIFRDGKLVLDGKDQQLDIAGQTDLARLRCAGALGIGGKMLPGDYILQLIVTDSLAKPKQRVTTQFVQFEVVE